VSSKYVERHYIEDSGEGYPASPDLFYECNICGDVLPSQPEISMSCRCGNVRIDSGYGRLALRDPTKMRIFVEVEELR
jgi:hypothetical protein